MNLHMDSGSYHKGSYSCAYWCVDEGQVGQNGLEADWFNHYLTVMDLG